MADSFVGLPADDVGKKVDTESLTVGAETVQRERVQVAGSAAAAVAAVTNAAPTTEYGLVTRNIPSGTQPVSGTVSVTEPVSVDDNGGSLTVDGTVAVSSLPALPAGVNNIGDVDVLTLPALPAGTNNIGDVDVLTLPALPAGTNVLGKVSLVDGVGDSAMDDANNALRVNIVAGAAAGGTSATDEAAYTPTGSSGTPIMGAADETAPDAAAEGTLAIIRSTLSRALHVNLRDASGNEVSPGGGTQYDEDTAATAAEKLTMAGVVRKDAAASLVDTDGDRTELQVDASGRLHVNASGVTQPVSAASLPLPTGAATEATLAGIKTGTDKIPASPATDRTTAAAPFSSRLSDGAAFYDAAKTGQLPAALVGGRLDVNVGAAIVAGDNNIGNVDIVTMPNVTLAAGTNTNEVVGDAADAAAAAGNPVSMGLTARQTNRTAVSDGNAVRAVGDDIGRQVVVMNQVRDLVQQDAAITLSSTTETTLIAAGAAGVFHDLTLLMITNSSATAVRVDFRDATAGTIRFSVAIAANGGAIIPFAVPWKQTTAANNWTAQLSAAVTDVRVAAQAVKNV